MYRFLLLFFSKSEGHSYIVKVKKKKKSIWSRLEFSLFSLFILWFKALKLYKMEKLHSKFYTRAIYRKILYTTEYLSDKIYEKNKSSYASILQSHATQSHVFPQYIFRNARISRPLGYINYRRQTEYVMMIVIGCPRFLFFCLTQCKTCEIYVILSADNLQDFPQKNYIDIDT